MVLCVWTELIITQQNTLWWTNSESYRKLSLGSIQKTCSLKLLHLHDKISKNASLRKFIQKLLHHKLCDETRRENRILRVSGNGFDRTWTTVYWIYLHKDRQKHKEFIFKIFEFSVMNICDVNGCGW